MRPKISVLMGVYNCADTLQEALKSIQKQTNQNWELILCDDGSTDATFKIAQKIAAEDKRIVLLKNTHNQGLNKSLNRCLKAAVGEYIARMDGDDLCKAERFEMQSTFLDQHPEYDIVSTPMILFDESGEWGRTTAPEKPEPKQLVAGNPIAHAPAMMRREALLAVNGYTEEKYALRVEDVDLWIKMYANGSKAYNLQIPLYCMRNDQNALNRRKYRFRMNSVYVRLQGCRYLQLGPMDYIRACKPMVAGIIPARIRQNIRKKQMKTTIGREENAD